MLVIPAIDLLDRKCVRLFKGRYDSATVYYDDPLDAVKLFVDSGVKLLHLVDLDAARGQGKNNRGVIKSIVDSFDCDIEVGGGVRTESDIEELLSIGVNRLIVGTVLAKEPKLVESWVKKYGDVFVAGIDALDGKVKVSGWEAGSSFSDVQLAKLAEDIGCNSIIYTNIAKDGTLSGPDIDNTLKIAREVNIPVILSGGVSSDSDIDSVGRCSELWGVITGKAVYENKIDIKSSIRKWQL